MNCKQFSECIGDYVNRTLGENTADAKAHLSTCAQCAALAKEMEDTSLLVRSLDRMSTPAGFEERLKARLASSVAPSGARGRILNRIRAIGKTLLGTPTHERRLLFRPVLATLLLCIIIAGSVFMFIRGQRVGAPDTDWAYIETCREQHASFAATDPLADESAVILKERAHELNEGL